jgi:uroporphyrinogen-III decarboxylase
VVPRGRSKKYLIENKEDVEALSCLFSQPDEKQLRAFEEQVNRTRGFAEENQLLTECGATFTSKWLDGDSIFLGDALHWLCGFENSVILARRNPDLMHDLLDVISDWSLQSIRLVTQLGGCDVIMHRGWYECFWSPKLYRTFLAPRIKKEVDLAHRAGAKFCYIMTYGLMPFLEILKEIGVDILYGVDPVQGNADLQKVKETLRGRICIWGGVNSAVTLTGNKQGVEKAVEEAFRILAPEGGFILAAIDQLFEDTKWDNFITMIQTWRRLSANPPREGS